MRKFLDVKGIALVEIMLAAGLVGGISLVVMKLTQDSQKSVVSMEVGTDVEATTRGIQELLSTPDNCLATLIGKNAELTEPEAISGILVPPSMTPSFTTDMSFGTKQLKIASYEITEDDPKVDVSDWGTTHLVITFDRGSRGVGTQLIKRKIPLKVVVDDDKNIETCVSLSHANDNIWKYAGNNADIYYPALVGIGAINPGAEPSTLLHVKGGSFLVEAYDAPSSGGGPSQSNDPTATNIPREGAGSRMFFWPERNAFRAGQVLGTEWDLAQIGQGSSALGIGTIASQVGSFAAGSYAEATGQQSAALGQSARAQGQGSMALGWNSTAVAYGSTAMGGMTTANGDFSTAAGISTSSDSYVSFVIGQFNRTVFGSNTSWVSGDQLFVIGNGTSDGARSNALTIFKNGTLLSEGVVNTSSTSIPATGAGSRMFFWPEKAALRAGRVGWVDSYPSRRAGGVTIPARDVPSGTTYWDLANVGTGSVGLGFSPLASGENSIVLGKSSASGLDSMALGYGGVASGENSIAIGNSGTSRVLSGLPPVITNDIGGFVLPIGFMSADPANPGTGGASGARSIVIGSGSAAGISSMAIGYNTSAYADGAVSIGVRNIASGLYSTSLGSMTRASGNFALSMGLFTRAQAYNSVVMGQFNVVSGTTNSWVATEPLLVAGNSAGFGTAEANALTLFKDGNMTIAGTLTESSDLRQKKNIFPLDSSLEKLNSIQPVTYEWKRPELHGQGKQMGVIAQEVQKFFPEAVRKNEDSFLSVSYSQLIAPVIAAIQELYKKFLSIDEIQNNRSEKIVVLKTRNEAHKKDIQRLKTENDALRSYLCRKDPFASICLGM